MKHLIRGATLTLMVAVAMILAGCASTRHKERTVSQEALSTAASEYLDTLGTTLSGSLTLKKSGQKECRMTHAITAEGIAAESAKLNVPIQSLRDLPDGAGYTAKDGRAGVELRKEGDNITVTGRCDSISRLYHFYREMSLEQYSEIDSLRRELSRLEKFSATQTAELKALHEEQTKARDKPPETRHWWTLAGFVAGVLCASPIRKLKNKITTLIKK